MHSCHRPFHHLPNLNTVMIWPLHPLCFPICSVLFFISPLLSASSFIVLRVNVYYCGVLQLYTDTHALDVHRACSNRNKTQKIILLSIADRQVLTSNFCLSLKNKYWSLRNIFFLNTSPLNAFRCQVQI